MAARAPAPPPPAGEGHGVPAPPRGVDQRLARDLSQPPSLFNKIAQIVKDVQLRSAAKYGDVPTCRRWLARGANPNAHGWMHVQDKSALMKAAERGHVDICQLLLQQQGVDPNFQDQSGNTAMHWACGLGQVEAARLLLSEGALVNRTNKMGRTPLHIAVLHDEVEVVQMLLQCEDMECAIFDLQGNTPLHIASQQGNRTLCRILLKHCPALATATNETGLRASDLCSRHLQLEFVVPLATAAPRTPEILKRVQTHARSDLLDEEGIEGGWESVSVAPSPSQAPEVEAPSTTGSTPTPPRPSSNYAGPRRRLDPSDPGYESDSNHRLRSPEHAAV